MLRSHMNAKENALVAISQVPANSGHPLHKGTPREAFVKEFLEDHLPSTVSIGTGEIIDSSSAPGQPRRQHDIVIYKRNFPKLDFGGGINAFLIESVVATVEVKTTLDIKEMAHAIEVASQAKKLIPSAVTAFTAGYIPPKILNLVIAYDGPASMKTVHGWLHPLHTALGIGAVQLPTESAERVKTPSASIDAVFVLQKGFLYFDNFPFGFSNDEFRKNNPNFIWTFADSKTDNLLLFFVLLQHATSNVEGKWLAPLPYLKGLSMTGIVHGT